MSKLILRTFFEDLDGGDLAFVKAFLDRMECVDDGNSASRIVDWINGLEV